MFLAKSKAFSKTFGATDAPSEANASINLKELLEMVAGATSCTPSESKSTENCGVKWLEQAVNLFGIDVAIWVFNALLVDTTIK